MYKLYPTKKNCFEEMNKIISGTRAIIGIYRSIFHLFQKF